MPRLRRNRAASFRPCVELLESRWVPTTITPTTFADGGLGSGSLRYCINQAADGDTITFGVQGTIALTQGELAISKDLDIGRRSAGR